MDNSNNEYMAISEDGKNVSFHCDAADAERIDLDWCQQRCARYYHCDTVAMANDLLVARGEDE